MAIGFFYWKPLIYKGFQQFNKIAIKQENRHWHFCGAVPFSFLVPYRSIIGLSFNYRVIVQLPKAIVQLLNSTTQYNIYLYYAKDAIKSNEDKYLVTYKQEIVYNTTDNKWMTGDSFKGYAKLISLSNNGKVFGIEHNNKNVSWYADLPAGAVVVG